MNNYFTIGAVLFCCITVMAHTVKAATQDTRQPIAIDADSLEVIQPESKAIFQGNVKAVQGDMTLQSQQMTVYYDQDKQKTENSAMGALSRIVVSGTVRLTTPDESATSARGVYDAVRNMVYLFGDVVLKRGNNVLTGSKLEYSLTSGSSMLSGGVSSGANDVPKSSGRVRGVFVPGKQ